MPKPLKCAAVLVSTVLLLALSLSGCAPQKYTLRFNEAAWQSLNLTHSGFASLSDFEKEVHEYIGKIADYTGRTQWDSFYRSQPPDEYELELEFSTTAGASYTMHSYSFSSSRVQRIYLKQDFLEHRLAPIAHELTHVMFPSSGCDTLSEGLACHMQELFGKNPTVMNFGADIHACALMYRDIQPDYFNAIYNILGVSSMQESTLQSGNSRQIFYIMSHSFTKYLIDTYGIKPYMELYESRDTATDCIALYGMTIDELRLAWKAYLDAYPTRLSPEAFQSHIITLFEEHNYTPA